MTNSGMLVCSFYLKKKFCREENELYSLNKEIVANNEDNPKSFSDFFEILSTFYNNNLSFSDDEKTKKMFSIKEDSLFMQDADTYRAMTFVIKSGSYGIEADMTNRHTMKVSYHRNEDEADVKMFRCVVFIPKDIGSVSVNKGIFAFQSIATYGVKTITVHMMKRFFSELGFTLETRSVSIQSFLQKLIDQGSLNKITFIRNNISPNTADNILISTGREEKSYIKPHLNEKWLSKILAIFEKADKDGIVEIPDDENFDDLSIQFKLGNSLRTVRLKNLDRLSIVEDIPEGIVCKNDETKLINYMIETANAYKKKIVFEVSEE